MSIEQLAFVPAVPVVTVEVAESFPPPPGGFLELRAESLRLRAAGGELSARFDYFRVERTALDAVVVVPYFLQPGASGGREPWVVLRSAVRPPAALRSDPVPGENSGWPGHGFWEVPAGLIEAGEESPAGQRRAAQRELKEETGLFASEAQFELLGPISYPCPGVIGERQTFFCVEVDLAQAQTAELDGSVLEQAGRVIAVPLKAALAAVAAGEVGDMKSELCLRRLAERLAA